MPPGVAIADFILFDGKPPVDRALAIRKQTTLQELRTGYLETHGNGAIEKNMLIRPACTWPISSGRSATSSCCRA